MVAFRPDLLHVDVRDGGAPPPWLLTLTRAGIIRPRPGRVPERPKGAVCKIAGIAYTGSNPVPATTALSCGNAAAGWAITPA